MSHLQLATEDEINAQVDLLFGTYGMGGRMAHVTADDAREAFCQVLMAYPAEVVELAVREIIDGRWPEHQGQHLPSTAVVAHATRHHLRQLLDASERLH